ncbi:hypothetical protein LC653_31360 [Nostoc sp. CHAB 5784]|uniref:hypothetical protein n=1 Tax=Nostoc mirabile TaxID=2907820 RepID=UPI001E3CB1D3|nr:hypothetical protein [Nostoc mirabile]MCC5668241.1 hypothetical protein [Nostoc mirabile CHAB5784]
MATIKISELQPESQFEKLSDADLRLVNGGQAFQFTTVGSTLVTGVAIGGGRIENGTQSTASLNAGVGSPVVNASLFAGGFSRSFPGT